MSSGDPEIREPEKGEQENGEKKEEVVKAAPGQFLDPMKVLLEKGAGAAVNTYPAANYLQSGGPTVPLRQDGHP